MGVFGLTTLLADKGYYMHITELRTLIPQGAPLGLAVDGGSLLYKLIKESDWRFGGELRKLRAGAAEFLAHVLPHVDALVVFVDVVASVKKEAELERRHRQRVRMIKGVYQQGADALEGRAVRPVAALNMLIRELRLHEKVTVVATEARNKQPTSGNNRRPTSEATRRMQHGVALPWALILLSGVAAAVDIISRPYPADDIWPGGPQQIPGRVWCAYADLENEKGYHINGTCKNRCSCDFNPCDGTYYNTFRRDECLTTCYTKDISLKHFGPFCCDTFAENGTQVPTELLMVGFVFVGNWYSWTVDVAEAGEYAVSFLGSSHHGGEISFDVDYKPVTGNVNVKSTGWWHNFREYPDLFTLRFDSPGLHVITMHVESISPPPGFTEFGNFVWFDFAKKQSKRLRM